MTTTYTRTSTILPYRIEVYRPDLSEMTATILYEHCHGSYAKRVEKALIGAELDDGEEAPSAATISSIVKIIEKVSKTESLSEPEVSVFYGEASVTWRCGPREVTLLSRSSADDPKLLRYESRDKQPGFHEMQTNVRVDDLLKAIGYSRTRRGWIYD